MLFSIGGTPYFSSISMFNWDASTWYYMGVSFDKTGGTFYMQAMTNNATATIQSFAFGSTTWGAGFLDSLPVRAGIRYITNDEGAEGQIDDIKIFSSETWNAAQFHYDYAVIIPEASTMTLLVGVGLVFARVAKRRRTV